MQRDTYLRKESAARRRRGHPAGRRPWGAAGRATAGAAAALIGLATPALAITIDGQFSDWTTAQLIGTDAVAAAGSGGFVDFQKVWAKFENGALFLSYSTQGNNIDFVNNARRYGVFLDTDSRTATGYRGADGSYAIGADYLIEGATIYRYTGSGTGWAWEQVPAAGFAYKIAGNRIEMGIPGSTLGMTGSSRIKIMLLGDNDNDATNDFARDDKAGFAFPRDQIVLDGSFGDWSSVPSVGTDVAGDVGPSDPVDWVNLRAKSQNGTLYLSFTTAKQVDFTNDAWRYEVLIDADNNSRTGYSDQDSGSGAEYLIEGATLYRHAGSGWSWNMVGRVPVGMSGTRLELAVAEQHLGLSAPYRIRLRLRGNNQAAADYAPGLNVSPGFGFASDGQQPPVACQRLATPSYFRSSALWNQEIARFPQTQIMVINPINGPGDAVDPEMWTNAAAAHAAGMTVLGYVHVYNRTVDAVLGDVDEYLDFYKRDPNSEPLLDGIFVDEVSQDCGVVDYYAQIDRHIRQLKNASGKPFLTVLNTGNYPGECYMSVGDIIIYEQPYSIYRTATPPSWMATYPAERFWHIIWNTSGSQMPTAINISRKRNAGYVYVTNDTLPNPYDTLPSYWAAEMTKLSELCP